ncbi:hypothetical protein IWZ03DRAFT_302045 [Phyllosticta citriasiana]|uniref:Uncharacterized protein n=1 Tax=Phyllosticta citriasiana TaxID=595635 RepID=A0ABR1KX00_9PEZI
MASTGPAPRVQAYGNGHPLPPGLDSRRHADFYAQLAQLRDQVLAGKHPHFKIPDHVLEKFAPQPVQSRPSPTSRNGPVNGTLPHPLPPHPLGHSPYTSTPTHTSSRSASAQHPPVSKPPSSEIDPVLLTKSDDLIRAEIQLKRQRVERLLKDQVEQRRVQSKDRDVSQDAGPELDVAQILAQVQQKVPPVSALPQETNSNSPASDSFDENSYYSSQANSWSSEESLGNACTADGAEALVSRAAHGNADSAKDDGLSLSQRELNDDLNLVDDGEESDYEPPGAEAFAPVPPPADPLQPPAESAQSSPRNANRGKRNASRNENEPRSGRQSPAAPRNQNNNSRKRRREQKEAQKEPRKRNTNKRVADSPEPYIKEEPVSPQPLGALPESSSDAARRGRAGGDDVEIISPREARPPVYYVEYEQPLQAPRYEMEPEVVRVPSRVAYRRVAERDDHDLRRYASLQYARRPFSPQPIPYEPIRYFEAPPNAAPIYREGSVRPSPRYIRSERSLSPPYGPDPYQRMRTPAMMAPPPRPRRIVVDQYGNRYYAEPAVPDIRASVAPPMRVRSGAVEEMLYERSRTRAPTLQPVARAVEYEDEGVQRMPPPPQHRRFYEEAAELEPVDVHRGYRKRDYSMRPPLDHYRGPLSFQFRYDDMAPPPARDFGGRSYSVRPEALGGSSSNSRREMPADYLSRHGSVAPLPPRGAAEYPRRAAAVAAAAAPHESLPPPPHHHAYRDVSVHPPPPHTAAGAAAGGTDAGGNPAPPPHTPVAAQPYDDHRRYAGGMYAAPPMQMQMPMPPPHMPPPLRRYADEPDALERGSPMVDAAGYMFNGDAAAAAAAAAVPRMTYRY